MFLKAKEKNREHMIWTMYLVDKPYLNPQRSFITYKDELLGVKKITTVKDTYNLLKRIDKTKWQT